MITSTHSTDTEAFLRLMFEPGDTFEIRALNCPEKPGSKFSRTYSGYYTDIAKAAQDAAYLDKCGGPAVYVTVNPVLPELLARANNHLVFQAKSTTSDDESQRRVKLFVDIDPIRPANVSSNSAECEAAVELAYRMRDMLASEGWPDALLCMTGNGAALFWTIDLPNDSDSLDLVTRVMKGLGKRFDTDAVKVDQTPVNAARICKVIGTTARKGDNLVGVPGLEDRPHRKAWFEVPEGPLNPVPRDLLEAVAVEAEPVNAGSNGSSHGSFDLEAWLREFNVDVSKPNAWKGGGRKWTFNTCPMCEHGSDGPHIVQLPSGAISAGCHHDSCSWTWRDLKEKFQPTPDVSRILDSEKFKDTTFNFRKSEKVDAEAEQPPVDDKAAKLFTAYPKILTAGQLVQTYPERRPVVIDQLLREGDVGNMVSSPKVGKSWLVGGMGMCVATGRRWLDCFETTQGRVLYVDNELHPTDAAFRLEQIQRAMLLDTDQLGDAYQVASFRGIPAELKSVCDWLRYLLRDKERGHYKLIIIDTLSKMLAGDKSENDNLYIRSIYTTLEQLAGDLGAAVVIVHHSSRGDQSEKNVTDVGAGAGSQTRACDCHMVIRPHSKEGWFVLDSTVRSFPGNDSLSICWDYPVWYGDPLMPAELATRDTQRQKSKAEQAEREILLAIQSSPEVRWSVNKLNDAIEGVGYQMIRKTCEKLVDERILRRVEDRYQGKEVTYYTTGS